MTERPADKIRVAPDFIGEISQCCLSASLRFSQSYVIYEGLNSFVI